MERRITLFSDYSSVEGILRKLSYFGCRLYNSLSSCEIPAAMMRTQHFGCQLKIHHLYWFTLCNYIYSETAYPSTC